MVQRTVRHMVSVGTCGLLAMLVAGVARANDSALQWGGSPRPMSGHPTVSMESEDIHMTIQEKSVVVTCRFVFNNRGPACRVRMGFPDTGYGAGDVDEEQLQRPVRGNFDTFTSTVNGKPVPTTTVRSSRGMFWHVKRVAFGANSRTIVEDRYTEPVGNRIAASNVHQGTTNHASYILHTGASWHGPIGRTTVRVTFQRSDVSAPIRPIRARLERSTPQPRWPFHRQDVFYAGPCRPSATGKTLVFERTNWTPSVADDISLTFGYRGN